MLYTPLYSDRDTLYDNAAVSWLQQHTALQQAV